MNWGNLFDSVGEFADKAVDTYGKYIQTQQGQINGTQQQQDQVLYTVAVPQQPNAVPYDPKQNVASVTGTASTFPNQVMGMLNRQVMGVPAGLLLAAGLGLYLVAKK